MDQTGIQIDKNRIGEVGESSLYFHTPSAIDLLFPYHVAACGRTRALPSQAAVVRRYDQHVLILTLAGQGEVEVNGQPYLAGPGSLCWLDTGRQYAHSCSRHSDDWHYLWLGMQGFGLDSLLASLSHGDRPPVIVLDQAAPVQHLFETLIERMATRPPDQSAADNADVAQILARLLNQQTAALTPDRLSPVQQVMQQMRAALARPWHLPELARLAGLSVSQLHRVFRHSTGMSPMSWLRLERIHAAKTLLVSDTRSIAAVAEAVGYPDPYHFSRDFRRLTQRSPSAFRLAGGA
ncbi:AraC family transcriptional regulator [Paludibacterium sp. B53371]|uniref:helix-turn-helix transcriptional regulator n=1 Tax=Paludibacterium sp. B53371 TaxID=2806263 RepID=UPI001C03CF9B|nr:AraC family transcriptional regulator [Paludibacterium sp. B53371]